MPDRTFTCPFEERGRQTNSIFQVILASERGERLAKIRAALETFYRCGDYVGIQFTFPQEFFEGCRSLAELKVLMLPYQAEILAADIDMRLFPYLPYQSKENRLSRKTDAPDQEFARSVTASALMQRMTQEVDWPFLDGVVHLSEWIRCVLEELRNKAPPVIGFVVVYEPQSGIWHPMMHVEPGSVAFSEEIDGECRHKNVLSVVKSPLYPKGTGRYSDTVEVFLNRIADVDALTDEQKCRIRRDANLAYQAAGIVIPDLDTTSQCFGVWVPQYRE
jgi:hypothetical protein